MFGANDGVDHFERELLSKLGVSIHYKSICMPWTSRRRITVDIETEEKVRHMLTRWLKPMSKKNRDGSKTMPFACGKTKVFFKAGAQDRLEHLRRRYYEKSARTIQFSAMRLSSLKKDAVYKIQSFFSHGFDDCTISPSKIISNYY